MALHHLAPKDTIMSQTSSSQARPVYLKLRDQIAAAIIEGVYPEGDMLPSVRALAAEQGANPLTVAKAYQQFQNDGLVEVRRGVGMYVVPGAAERLRERERSHFLREEWPEIRTRMERLGLDPVQLLETS
jgi:GntR family transcriptional regulator